MGGTRSGLVPEQLPEPACESVGERSTDLQVSRADCGTHASRLFSHREPGMDLGSARLSPGKAPVFLRNALDVTPGQRPYRVVARDHACDEVLDLTPGLVVGPQPDADPGLTANNRPIGRRSSELDIRTHASQPIRDRRPTGGQIIVRVYHDAHHFPVGCLERRSDCIAQ